MKNNLKNKMLFTALFVGSSGLFIDGRLCIVAIFIALTALFIEEQI